MPHGPQVGLWLLGARGSVATTATVGLLATAAGHVDGPGLVTPSPLFFGADKNRGLRLKPGKLELEVVTLSEGAGGIAADDVLVHDETNRALAHMLVSLEPPTFPVALGVIYCNPVPSFEVEVYAQAGAAGAAIRAGERAPDPAELFLAKEGTWTVR